MKNYDHLKLKFLLLSIFIFTSNTIIHAQSKIKGNRDVISEQIDVADFSTISIENDFEVLLVKSTVPSVTLEADSNLHDAINFQVNDSVLNFRVTKDIRRSKALKLIIRYSDILNTLVLAGSVDVEADNTIKLPRLNITLNDDARIDAEIDADVFTLKNNNNPGLTLSTNCVLEIESKSATLDLRNKSNNIIDINTEKLKIKTHDNTDLDIEGFAYNLDLFSTNSSTINGKDLLTNVTSIVTAEKSEIEVNVSETVKIDASGSSIINLYGSSKIMIDQMQNNATLKKNEL